MTRDFRHDTESEPNMRTSLPVSELVERLEKDEVYRDGSGYVTRKRSLIAIEASTALTTLSTRNAELEREVKRLREALDEIDRRYRNGANADTLVLIARKAALSTSPKGRRA